MKQTQAPSGAFLFSNEPPTKEAFLFAGITNLNTANNAEKRTFSGVAYSGELIPNHWAWGDLVFDLDSTELAQSVPALINHDPDRRAGYVTGHNTDDKGLTVTGNMLSNEFGTEVSRDGDDGFPWQMSVHIDPQNIEHIEQGEVTVNGKTFQAPITVFRNNIIREAGFVSVGADKNTTAKVFNHSNKQGNKHNFSTNPKPIGGTDMDLEEAKAKIAELEADSANKDAKLADAEAKLAQAEEDKAKAESEQRQTEIDTLAKDTGAEFTDEDKAQFSKMDADAFAFSASQLRKAHANKKPKPNTNLFGRVADDGVEPAPTGDDLDASFARAVAKMEGN